MCRYIRSSRDILRQYYLRLRGQRPKLSTLTCCGVPLEGACPVITRAYYVGGRSFFTSQQSAPSELIFLKFSSADSRRRVPTLCVAPTLIAFDKIRAGRIYFAPARSGGRLLLFAEVESPRDRRA
ncbi:hypothetical protein EVAR_92054_1 [Eumeta japonica]|uniref:Uncharacterized protein n=1 Tax=Eumeta variegata TaxID=151549 RepID=A0A4C1SZ16_EUMVA|nr:hypothetical protein EVAR_92054_1 [Eumeta japonica]